jgi:hypothetical protein
MSITDGDDGERNHGEGPNHVAKCGWEGGMNQFLGNFHESAPNAPQDRHEQGKEQPLGKLHAITF